MALADYNKEDCTEFGAAIANLIEAVSADGVGTDDFDEAIAVLTAAARIVNEAKDVPIAAGLHTLSAAAGAYGDKVLAKAIAEAGGGNP